MSTQDLPAMILPLSYFLPPLRLKAPLREAVDQDQADPQLPTNPHSSQVVLDQDRNYQASEGQKTSTSLLEMRHLQPEQDLDMVYTTL